MKVIDSGDQTFEVGEVFHSDFIVDGGMGGMIPYASMVTCDEDGKPDDESGAGDHHKIIKRCRIKYIVYA